MLPAFLTLLAEIPFLGYIVAFFLAVLAMVFGVSMFGLVKVDLVHLTMFGIGIYILLMIIREYLPMVLTKDRRGKVNELALVYLTIFAIILIVLGVPNAFLSALGQSKYSVILP